MNSSNAMAVKPIGDYDAAFEDFDQRTTQNCKTFARILDTSRKHIIEAIQYEEELRRKIEDEITDLQKKIENIQHEMETFRTDKDSSEREKQKLLQECDQLNLIISQKVHERDKLKELLVQRELRLKEKELQVNSEEQKHQEKIQDLKKDIILYEAHLGLRIERTRKDTIILIFTQIKRSDPNKEFMLELALEEDNYRLINSNPVLPNLHEIEAKLNITNNFSVCVAHIRKLFQNMDD